MTTTATGEAQETILENEILKTFAKAAVRIHFPEQDKYGNPNLSRFFFDNGHLPYATDNIKPWMYRGWLIPYLQMCEAHPLVAKRYDYVLRTLDAGCLLDEPLPQIRFVGEFEPATKDGIKMLDGLLEFVEYRSGCWNGMREFCEWLAFALGVTHEASKMTDDVQEHLYRNFNLEPLVLHPSDYLGQMLCQTQHGKRNGFYPTPIHLVELMTRLTNCTGGDRRRETTIDPCVGTGRMLLIASNYSMRLYGQDIDYLCCLITKINLALYAPWFYIPESFFGDENAPKQVDAAIESSLGENSSQNGSMAQTEVIQPERMNLFEQLRLQKQGMEKRKSKKGKTFSTEIEQPTLFGF